MIAIVSSGGRLGQMIAAQLLARGHDESGILFIHSTPGSDSQDTIEGIATRSVDKSNRDSILQAFTGVKTLVLIPNAEHVEKGIRQHNAALATAKECGVEKIILLSLSCAQTDSRVRVTPFLLYTENMLRNSGLDWLILRRSLFIDSISMWTQQLIHSDHVRFPTVGGRCSYVSKADVAAAAAAACDSSFRNEVFDLTGPSAISIQELSNAIGRCNSEQLEFRITSDEDFRKHLQSQGVSTEKSELLLSFFHGMEAGEFARATDHVEKLTGQRPESVLATLRRLAGNNGNANEVSEPE